MKTMSQKSIPIGTDMSVTTLKIPTHSLTCPMHIRTPTGVIQTLDQFTPKCELTLANHVFVYDFIVFNLYDYDLIQGMDWLS